MLLPNVANSKYTNTQIICQVKKHFFLIFFTAPGAECAEPGWARFQLIRKQEPDEKYLVSILTPDS
jgi:hypothetical protein